MKDKNYEQVRAAFAIFKNVFALHPEEQQAQIEQYCCRNPELRNAVLQLLHNDQGTKDAESDPLVGAGPQALADELASTLPASDKSGASRSSATHRRIGRYRVLRKIGEGGMGAVYEAQQDQPQRSVALKVISPHLFSDRVRQRFELEAQVLARLQHPGIAQIYDAGTATDEHGEIPFIAMELIKGDTLGAYMKKKDLSTPDRLKLFVRICRAVEHAHQHGVIHRDLKPGNILVDASGAPRILDFGIARLAATDDSSASHKTTAGQMLGTVPYMSPEQIAGNTAVIDTRTDVYALGVILYELLGNRLPYDVTNRPVPEAAKIITESEAPRLGSLHRSYRGDLETIVAKALERDQEQRYGTVSDLAADVDRFLTQQPILARPPSATYQLRKLIVRHKIPFLFAASLFALSICSAIWMSILYQRARSAEFQARTEAETARQTSSLLVDLFKMTNPSETRGRTITVAEILDRGAERVQNSLHDQPEVKAQLQYTIGTAYRNLGLYKEAQPLLAQAMNVYRGSNEPTAQLADALSGRGILLENQGNYHEAEKLLKEAIDIRKRVQPDEALLIANDTNTLAGLHLRQGRKREALRLYQQALDLRRPRLGEEHADIAETIANLGVVHKAFGDVDKAEDHFRRAHAIQETVLPENHPSFISTYYNLGEILGDKGNLTESRAYYELALGLDRRVNGKNHPHLAISLDGVGKAYFAEGNYARAEERFEESLGIHRRTHGTDHQLIVVMLNNTAEAELMLGKVHEAKKHLLECAEMAKRVYGMEHPQAAIPINNVSMVEHILGQFEEAYTSGREALAIKRSAIQGDHPSIADSLHDLGAVQLDLGHLDQAISLIDEGREMRIRIFGEEHRAVGQSLSGLALALNANGQTAEAEAQMQRAITVLRSTIGEQHPDYAHGLFGMGKILLNNGDAQAAGPYLQQALELRQATLPPDHWQTLFAMSYYGESLASQSRMTEAEPLLRKSAESLALLFGDLHPRVLEAISRLELLP